MRTKTCANRRAAAWSYLATRFSAAAAFRWLGTVGVLGDVLVAVDLAGVRSVLVISRGARGLVLLLHGHANGGEGHDQKNGEAHGVCRW